MQLFLKILSGMANSGYPDQTSGAVWSALFAYAILSHFVYVFLELPYGW